jgi:hypothetical protein
VVITALLFSIPSSWHPSGRTTKKPPGRGGFFKKHKKGDRRITTIWQSCWKIHPIHAEW